jgi:Galactose oxidase, central domain
MQHRTSRRSRQSRGLFRRLAISTLLAALPLSAAELPANRWVEIARDAAGARPGSAVRYAAASKQFVLWGYMNDDPDLLQEQPLMRVPEYDVVAFDPDEGHWRNQLPADWEELWSRRLPLASVPRAYAGITTGSERTVMRVSTADEGAAPRPDLNVIFDQLVYRAANDSLYYFTGGLTASYDVAKRRWRDLRPRRSPPPLLGGSLAYDPLHDEILLFGGGHVAERGPGAKVRGYTGTWIYNVAENVWRPLEAAAEPPPRMNTRIVTDTRNGMLVLFGGDSQQAYLADTWLFDLRTRAWKKSAAAGPPARAGHFTVYDPETGLVIVGGGYNRGDLSDMWGYDAARDRWQRLAGEVPAGFYLSADLAPDRRLIVLVSSTRAPDDRMTCNILFPVRTTYAFRIDAASLTAPGAALTANGGAPAANGPLPKRAPDQMRGVEPDAARRAGQAARLENLPDNRWVLLDAPGRVAPARTWGSATFDTDRGRILYWGGGHCGYEGSDVDAYDVVEHTWLGEAQPAYPERLWNHGVRPAGVTFDGAPWSEHGRSIYAYDPIGKQLVMAHGIRLTSGYEPAWLRDYPEIKSSAPDALITQPSSYRKFATFLYDAGAHSWEISGPAPAGLDTLVTTPRGVMGVPVNWPARLNDAGYNRPWSPSDPPEDNAVYLYRNKRWEKLSAAGPSPQNLYELTSLAWDSKREQLILHGGGPRRDELWTFDPKSRRWTNREPRVVSPAGAPPPACSRESVYLPQDDVMLTFGGEDNTWAYTPSDNSWRKVAIPFDANDQLWRRTGQNRAMVYDPTHRVVLLVLGGHGDDGQAAVFALRYRQAAAVSQQP